MRGARRLACILLTVTTGAVLSSSLALPAANAADNARPLPPAPRSPAGPHETTGDEPRPSPGLATAPSAAPRIGSAASIQVNVAASGANIVGDAANEPTIAVDPVHPNRIAIGWRQFDTVGSNFRQAGRAYSQDGGRTWHFPGVLTPGVFRSDPVLSSDASGNFYYCSLRVDGSDYTVNVFKSTDGGVTWSNPPAYAFGGDKQWLTVDRTAGIGRGHLYEAWSTAGSCCGTNTFTRSVNGGTIFPLYYALPQNPRWGSLEVGPDGAVYVAGVDANNMSRILVARSSNAQDRRYAPFFESVVAVDLGGSVSSFEGFTSPNPDGLLGQVWVLADHSAGPTAGWLYLICSLDPPGTDPLDVMFARSTDRGTTWSAPQRLNDDPPGAWQWFATPSVAPNGRLDVVWNDTRGSGQPNLSRLYYTSSSDGGFTWTTPVVKSPEWDSHVGFPNQNKIGDYYHMLSDLAGANLAWSATFNGEEDVWFLRLGEWDCNANGVGDSTEIASGGATDWNDNGIPDPCEGLQLSDVESTVDRFRLLPNTPNPFTGSTAIVCEATVVGGAVQVEIFDVAGRLVRTLGGDLRVGRNLFTWDGRDATGASVGAGIYVYRVTAPGFVATRRMVLVR